MRKRQKYENVLLEETVGRGVDGHLEGAKPDTEEHWPRRCGPRSEFRHARAIEGWTDRGNSSVFRRGGARGHGYRRSSHNRHHKNKERRCQGGGRRRRNRPEGH